MMLFLNIIEHSSSFFKADFKEIYYPCSQKALIARKLLGTDPIPIFDSKFH